MKSHTIVAIAFSLVGLAATPTQAWAESQQPAEPTFLGEPQDQILEDNANNLPSYPRITRLDGATPAIIIEPARRLDQANLSSQMDRGKAGKYNPYTVFKF